jgi:Rieske Fe-S protein
MALHWLHAPSATPGGHNPRTAEVTMTNPADRAHPTDGAHGPSGTRREFLAQGVRWGALAGVAGALSGCTLFLHKAQPDATLSPAGGPSGTLRVPDDLLPGAPGRGPATVLSVEGREDKLLLLRAAGGELVALTTVCTHRGCDVEYSVDAGHIVCPCHGSEYDDHGAVLEGPAKKPLHSYPVRVADGAVVIDLSG